MLKLMKYEWRKQWFSKVIMMAILAVLVLAFVVFSRLRQEDNAAVMLAFLILAAFSFCFFSGIEAVTTFHRDLKTRQSYLLFMIPQPAWKVLAAKFVIALLTMFFTSALCLFAASLCFLHEIAQEGMWHELYNALKLVAQMLQEELPRATELIPPLAASFCEWFFFISLAFFADVVIMTLFSNLRRGGTLLGVLLFLALAYGTGKLFDLASGETAFMLTGTYAWISCGYYAGLCVLLFLATSFLMERKLSV